MCRISTFFNLELEQLPAIILETFSFVINQGPQKFVLILRLQFTEHVQKKRWEFSI